MLILAIDSATPVAGVALLNESKVIREELVNYKKTHSETLVPMINQILQQSDCRLADISALAVTIGPGSFTGLRIGLGVVKGLSLAAGKPVIGIPTLDALAFNAAGNKALVCSLLDARKQEVYSALYDVSGSCPRRLGEIQAVSPQQLVELVRAQMNETGNERVIFMGDGFYPYQDFFEQALGNKLYVMPSHLMLPRASAAGSLAVEKFNKQEFEDIFSLRPVYVRLSEAEYRLGRGEL